MTAAPSPDRLSPQAQAAALSDWGRPGFFRCCVCGHDSTESAPLPIPTRIGLALAVCKPCGRRIGGSPTFRRKARQAAESAALRSLLQRVADLAGVTGAALMRALPLASLGDPAAVQRAEITLQLPPGSISGAFAQVLGAGARQ